MAPSRPALDLNAMVNADRQKRKNEALAQKIFGKPGNRRASAPGGGMNTRRPNTAVPALAARIGPVGVAKRTVSSANVPRAVTRPVANAGNVNAEWTHDLHDPSPASSKQPPRGPRATRPNRNADRLHNAIHGSASSPALNQQFSIVGTAKPAAKSISIRGLAGPSMVIAKNFAAGTTAADIESAMISVGGVILSCRIIAERPNCIAEITFETREGADNVVDTFNNQNADGNILHLYHKALPSSSGLPNIPSGPRSNRERSPDLIFANSSSDRFTARDRPREYQDYARDEVQDGSYGFEDKMETDDNTGLYSDKLVGNRGRGGVNSWDRGGRTDRSRGYR